MTASGKPIFDHTEEELRHFVRVNAPYEAFSTKDILAELDRRDAKRQGTAAFWLSVVGLGIAVVAIVVTAMK
jgi:hypothetical protein